MPIFLDPTGKTTYGIGIFQLCSRKFFLEDLYSDPNTPGLKVCKDDLDDYDPYRLAPRQADRIDLPKRPQRCSSPDRLRGGWRLARTAPAGLRHNRYSRQSLPRSPEATLSESSDSWQPTAPIQSVE
jgi:hypothetical protein